MTVFPYINFHTHSYNSENPCSIYVLPLNKDISDFDKGFFCVGWHPWELDESKEEQTLQRIKETAQNSNIIAIGETGLDRLCKTPFEYQVKVFKEHITLSEQLQKPLIIHCVKAFDELLFLKKQLNPTMPWVVHGFNNNAQIAKQLMQHNIGISFGKALQNEQSNAAQLIQSGEIEDFFLETDDAELGIEEVYRLAAKYKNRDIELLKKQIYHNFTKLFKISV